MSFYYHCDTCGKYCCEDCVDSEKYPICYGRFWNNETRFLCDCGDHLREYVRYYLRGDLHFVINYSKPTWRDLWRDPGQKKILMQIDEIRHTLRRTFTGVWDFVGVEFVCLNHLNNGQRTMCFRTTNFKVKVSHPSFLEIIQQIQVSLKTMKIQIEGLTVVRGGFQCVSPGHHFVGPLLDIQIATRRNGAVQAAVVQSPIATRKMKIIETIYESHKCVICLENPSEIVFSPCGHFCACKACGDRLEICCVCRMDIYAKVSHDKVAVSMDRGKSSCSQTAQISGQRTER